MAELEVKSFEVKAADEFGIIMGYAGVFDVMDRGNDILKKGALGGKKSIKVPMMANHHEGVIGHAIVTEDEKGLFYVGKLAVDSKSQKLRERAEEWYYAVKEGHVDRNSFGYIPVAADLVRKKIDGRDMIVRELKQIDLVEVSIVPVPMNPAAGVASVKALEKEKSISETLNRLEQRFFDLEKKLIQPEEPPSVPKRRADQDISLAVLRLMGRL